jgi:hypothetical protein
MYNVYSVGDNNKEQCEDGQLVYFNANLCIYSAITNQFEAFKEGIHNTTVLDVANLYIASSLSEFVAQTKTTQVDSYRFKSEFLVAQLVNRGKVRVLITNDCVYALVEPLSTLPVSLTPHLILPSIAEVTIDDTRLDAIQVDRRFVSLTLMARLHEIGDKYVSSQTDAT